MRTAVMLATFALAAVSSLAVVRAADFTYCSDASSVTISNITLDPEELSVGEQVSLHCTLSGVTV